MFGKSTITQSMIDAVKAVIGEDSVDKKEEVHNEQYLLDEAAVKIPTATGTRVLGGSYGNSAKAYKDQTRHSVDDVKEPTKKDIEKDSKLYKKTPPSTAKSYDQFGAHMAKESREVEKDEGHEDEVEDKKLIKKMVDKSCLKKEEMTFADRLVNSLKENKANGPQETFTDNNLGEMSDAQKEKREKIVKSMKDNEVGFKQRYGKRYKEVMYATATKNAMKKEEVELDEEKSVTTDTLNGRVDGGKANAAKPFKLQLKKNGEMKAPPVENQQVDTPARKAQQANKPTTNLKNVVTAEEVELDEATPPKNTDIADKSYLKTAGKKPTVKGDIKNFANWIKGKPETNEELVGGQKKLDKNHNDKLDSQDFKILRGKKKVSEGVRVDEKVIAGTSGWEKIPKDVKDKSGAVHTPMSRARDLARQAYKKIKQEVK